MEAANWLRLFPLERTVLFPGGRVQLVVFEPRYRQLLFECMEADEPFGVVLIRSGREVGEAADPYALGTTARIGRVARLPNGRLRLDAHGERRFRIEALDHARPYLRAQVSYPADEGAPRVDARRLARARGQLRTLARLGRVAGSEYRARERLPEAAAQLADHVADAATTDPAERQRLLAELDVPRRIDAAIAALEDAIVREHRRAQLRVAGRWGGLAARN